MQRAEQMADDEQDLVMSFKAAACELTGALKVCERQAPIRVCGNSGTTVAGVSELVRGQGGMKTIRSSIQ